MTDEEREELIWRRVSEKAFESANKQIKDRYFWGALAFAVVSWFGGAALITGLVQSHIAEKMEPAQRAVTEVKVVADQLSGSLKDQRKAFATLDDSLKDTNQRLDLAR